MKIKIEDFLEHSKNRVIIDVRSPAEYKQGHIPYSYNIPLLNNEERAIVGTIYKKRGKDPAFIKALEFAGPNMANFVKKAKSISKKKQKNSVLLYCWRGGMRSGSMAWLFEAAGIVADTLEGGYKKYRNHIQNLFLSHKHLIVLGGYTGSGKTEILLNLKQDCQVIDFEGIANHKGSAFGFIGQDNQPTTEQFENNLGEEWLKLDPKSEIWLEDESRNIGSVYLPENLYQRLRLAPVIFLDINKEARIERLVAEYSHTDKSEIKFALDKIIKRLGGLSYKLCVKALEKDDFAKIADITLSYYDKAYFHGLNKRNKKLIFKLKIDGDSPIKTANTIRHFFVKKIKPYLN